MSLIEQIGQKEGREARELRAQKAAKEAETRAKHKHPTGNVTLVFTDVQGSTGKLAIKKGREEGEKIRGDERGIGVRARFINLYTQHNGSCTQM